MNVSDRPSPAGATSTIACDLQLSKPVSGCTIYASEGKLLFISSQVNPEIDTPSLKLLLPVFVIAFEDLLNHRGGD
jgi:hypothetical protein